MDEITFLKLVNDVLMLEIVRMYGIGYDKAVAHKEQGTYSAYLKLRNGTRVPWHLFADNKFFYLVDDSENTERILLNTTSGENPELTDSAVDVITKYAKISGSTLASIITAIMQYEFFDEGAGQGRTNDNKSTQYREVYPAVTPYFKNGSPIMVSINGASPVDVSTHNDTHLATSIFNLNNIIADIGYNSKDGQFLKVFRLLFGKGKMRLERYVSPNEAGYQKLSSSFDTMDILADSGQVDKFTGKISKPVETEDIHQKIVEAIRNFIISDTVGMPDNSQTHGLCRIDYSKNLLAEEASSGKGHNIVFQLDDYLSEYTSAAMKLGVSVSSTSDGTEIKYYNKNNQREICSLTVNTITDDQGHMYANLGDMATINYISESSMRLSSSSTKSFQVKFAYARFYVVDFITIASAVADIDALVEYATSTSFMSSMIESDKNNVTATATYNITENTGAVAEVTIRSAKSNKRNDYTLSVHNVMYQASKYDKTPRQVKVLRCVWHNNKEVLGRWCFSRSERKSADGNFVTSTSNIFIDGKNFLETGDANSSFGAYIVKNTDAIKKYIQVNKKGRYMSDIDDTEQAKVDAQFRLQSDSPVGSALLDVRDAFVNTFGNYFLKRHNVEPTSYGGLSRLKKGDVFDQDHAEFMPGGIIDCGTFSAVRTNTPEGPKIFVTCYFPGNVWRKVTLSGDHLSNDFLKWYLLDITENPITNMVMRDIDAYVDSPDRVQQPIPITEQILRLFGYYDEEDSDSNDDEYEPEDDMD